MKLFRIITVTALSLVCTMASAQSSGYWRWTGTQFDKVPFDYRYDYSSSSNAGNLTPSVVERHIWAEGANLAFKDIYLGDYKVYHDSRKSDGGINREFHNHKGEYASATLSISLPEPYIRPGQEVAVTVKVFHNTDCGWGYDKPHFKMGSLVFTVGRETIGVFPADERSHSETYRFQLGQGARGAQMPFRFTMGAAGMGQTMVYGYEWVEGDIPSGGTGSSGSTGGGDDEDGIPSWVWWAGGIFLLLLLFRKRK